MTAATLETVEKNSIHMLKASAFYPGLVLLQLLVLVTGEGLWGISFQVSITYTVLPLAVAWALGYKITDIEKFPVRSDPISKNTRMGTRAVAVQATYYLIGFIITWTALLVAVYYGAVVPQKIMVGKATGLLIMNLCLVSPSETMVFQAMIPNSIERYFKGYKNQRALKYVISQLIFAGFHFWAYQGNISLMLTSTIFGGLFLYISETYGLSCCMGTHTAWNLVVLGVLSGGLIYE